MNLTYTALLSIEDDDARRRIERDLDDTEQKRGVDPAVAQLMGQMRQLGARRG